LPHCANGQSDKRPLPPGIGSDSRHDAIEMHVQGLVAAELDVLAAGDRRFSLGGGARTDAQSIFWSISTMSSRMSIVAWTTSTAEA